MKKVKRNLTAVGFMSGCIGGSRLDNYEPFEKKGKLGVRNKCNKRIVVEAAFTYIEVFIVGYDLCFLVGNEGKFGLYSDGNLIIPVQYESIVKGFKDPDILYAYIDADKKQFDAYWQGGCLAKGCKECIKIGFRVKVIYIDDTQELFNFIGNYEVNTIIEKGKYDIQLYKYHIIVDDGKPVVYNYKGCKVSEDASGNYVQSDSYLIHVTEKPEKFYNRHGKEVDLYKTYEEVVITAEYVLAKYKGHWMLLYSI